MIQANELRLGNYVDYYKEIIVLPHLQSGLLKRIKPIPITEKWILKLGFEPTGFDSYSFDGYEFSFENNSFFNKTVLVKKYVNSVHQLQNLYFALTGKELEKYSI